MIFSKITIRCDAVIHHKITANDMARFVALSGEDNLSCIDKKYVSHVRFKQLALMSHFAPKCITICEVLDEKLI